MSDKKQTVEEAIKLKAEREELRQLRNLEYNLKTGIVFDISPELMDILKNKDWRDL